MQRLVKRFPVDAIFGTQKMRGMPAATFAPRAARIMASEDNFVLATQGRGTNNHSAITEIEESFLIVSRAVRDANLIHSSTHSTLRNADKS